MENAVFGINHPTAGLQGKFAQESSYSRLIYLKQVLAGLLAGVVLIAATVRIASQIHNRRRLFLSDFFLLFACICLCAGTVVLYHFEDTLYLNQALAKGGLSVSIPPNFLAKVETSLKYLFSYEAIIWATVFSVKFSFLSFFRPLVKRLARLRNWWTCVTVVTALSWGFCTTNVFIICPDFNPTSCKCHTLICYFWGYSSDTLTHQVHCEDVNTNPKVLPVSALVICLDVLTDLMSISRNFQGTYCCLLLSTSY